jgi:hypothetical protein
MVTNFIDKEQDYSSIDLGRLEAMRELCLALRRPQRDEERLNGYFNLGGTWKY